MHEYSFHGILFYLKTEQRTVWTWGALAHLLSPDINNPQRKIFLCLAHPWSMKQRGSKAPR